MHATRIEVVTHTDQLYAMGIGSVVLAQDGCAAQKRRNGWLRVGDTDTWSAVALLDYSPHLEVLRWVPKGL